MHPKGKAALLKDYYLISSQAYFCYFRITMHFDWEQLENGAIYQGRKSWIEAFRCSTILALRASERAGFTPVLPASLLSFIADRS